LIGSAGPALPESQPAAVVISRDDCRRLVRYHPEADVAYKPGVDVHGKAVVPADLPRDEDPGVPQKISIDLKALLGQVPSNNAPALLGQSYVNTGQVSIDLNDGSVTLNGKKVGADADSAIADACRKAGVR
jgi:hypothetical protein